MLRDLPNLDDPRVLSGRSFADDAGIFRLTDTLALIQTVDFFTPVVDDPYTFGKVAAANALSDIYAMGGTPLTALNIVVFPTQTISSSVLGEILRGGADKATEAGVSIIGGHTVEGEEPMYGMSVTGTIDPARAVFPSGGRPDDVLILTKPIGTGVIATALKAECADPSHVAECVGWMDRLNRNAGRVMADNNAHASTDVTGFGLLGHLRELALASQVQATISASAIPLLPGAFDYAHRGFVPGGGQTNLAYVKPHLITAIENAEDVEILLADPQTSGGLLMAVAGEDRDRVLQSLEAAGEKGWVIGQLTEGPSGTILLVE